MSYILDALVQAELERQSRGVPGLHTVQTLPHLRPLPPPRRRWPILVSGAAGLGGLLALAWMQPWHRDVLDVPAPLVGSASILAAATQAKAAVVSLDGPGLTTAAPVQRLQAVPETPTVVATPADPPRRHHRKVHKGKTRKPPAKIAVGPGLRLYNIAELPPELQAAARKVSVAGFARSDNPKERMAIINDRALREGDEVSGGLRVEQIAGDGVVFNLKGYRFRKGRS